MTAFIIMPFGKDDYERASFKSIYEHFKEKLSESGFDAWRADEISSENRITSDIIEAIRTADIVIAELTGGNPNVFYELAIAHSLDKPVISLTQDPEDALPFDLVPQRVTRYSRDFDQMRRAEDALRTGCTAYLDGKKGYFDNPISNHFDRPIRTLTVSGDVVDEPGLLDYNIELEEGAGEIVAIFEELHKSQISLNREIESAAQKITRARSSYQRQIVCRQLADSVNQSADLMIARNSTYQELIDSQEISLTAVLQLSEISNEEDKETTRSLIATLRGLIESITSAQESIGEFKTALDTMPNIEQRFNQARLRLASSIGQLFDLFTRHREVIHGGVTVAEGRLLGM